MSNVNGRPGRFLSDDLLADTSLSLPAKVILEIIRGRICGKRTFTMITNEELARRTGKCVRTIQRVLQALEKKELISLVQDTRVLKHKHSSSTAIHRPTTFRYIYLDRRKAGHRKRKIGESKRTVEPDYKYFVLMKGMTEKQFVAMKRAWAKEERDRQDEEEDRRYQWFQAEFFAESSDEEIDKFEKADKVRPGTYLKLKQEYIKSHQISGTGDDGLFDT